MHTGYHPPSSIVIALKFHYAFHASAHESARSKPRRHITNKIVEDKPPVKGSDDQAKLQELVNNINIVIVAHNAQFDMKILQMEGIHTQRVICTIKLARYLERGWTRIWLIP